MANSMLKYSKHRTGASKTSMTQSRELGNIGIHPALLDWVTDEDKKVMEVHEILKQFRPTHNMIEIGY